MTRHYFIVFILLVYFTFFFIFHSFSFSPSALAGASPARLVDQTTGSCLRCSFDCRLWLFCLCHGPFCLPVCHEQRGEVGRSYNERLACRELQPIYGARAPEPCCCLGPHPPPSTRLMHIRQPPQANYFALSCGQGIQRDYQVRCGIGMLIL